MKTLQLKITERFQQDTHLTMLENSCIVRTLKVNKTRASSRKTGREIMNYRNIFYLVEKFSRILL